jgi:uncharacterized protein YcbK (DUF882 family)
MLELTQSLNNLKTIKIPGSKNFTWHEALYLERMSAYVVPSLEQMTNIIKTVEILERIRAHFNTPITITSWLRPYEYNKLIGGAMFSFHKRGLAVDFLVMGLSSEFVRQELKRHPELLLGASVEKGTVHVHIQNDNRSLWFDPPPVSKKGLS